MPRRRGKLPTKPFRRCLHRISAKVVGTRGTHTSTPDSDALQPPAPRVRPVRGGWPRARRDAARPPPPCAWRAQCCAHHGRGSEGHVRSRPRVEAAEGRWRRSAWRRSVRGDGHARLLRRVRRVGDGRGDTPSPAVALRCCGALVSRTRQCLGGGNPSPHAPSPRRKSTSWTAFMVRRGSRS